MTIHEDHHFELQALTNDKELFGNRSEADSGPKISMKKLFERPKVKVDGSPSKVQTTAVKHHFDLEAIANYFCRCALCWLSLTRHLPPGQGAAGDGGAANRRGDPGEVDILLCAGRKGHVGAVPCPAGLGGALI